MTEMTKQGHIHAELMVQYAEDAKTNAKPWLLWQVACSVDQIWDNCCSHPMWKNNLLYRHKQQVLKMTGMTKQGHIHAELMVQYAEIARTHKEPWKNFQWRTRTSTRTCTWSTMQRDMQFESKYEFRRKPKTHIVHGVEVPDLRIKPKVGEVYYMPSPLNAQSYLSAFFTFSAVHNYRKNNNLCYEYTEEGKQAAILHAKAWLGIA